MATRADLVEAGKAHDYLFGTYEAGPGYAMPGLNNQEAMSFEQLEAQDMVGKSLANGTATLDAFLGRAQMGLRVQNFFTLGFGRRYWKSHAPLDRGGQPYPSWMALALFNNHATGTFLKSETLRVPTRDLEGHRHRRAVEAAPMVALYATRQDDRLSVFVLSRKIPGYPDPADDGWTPVTLHLPVAAARKATLYKMTGDPASHNLDEWKVKVQTVEDVPFSPDLSLTRATTGEARDGMPPGGILLYVFEGVR
jgi:hypothetical protein